MRTVPGRPTSAVVVGAGLSGLSAAMHLAGRGLSVTVLERDPHPGGRVGRYDVGGYRIDTGPTVLTMPDLIDDAFAAVGDRMVNRLEPLPVDPAYLATFADGSSVEVHRDADRMAAEVARFAGAAEADGYLRLRAWLGELYRTEFDGFIAANYDSPLALLTPNLAKLAAIGGFRRWDPMIRKFLRDERLQRVFSFQALYAGVPPQSALAVYAVIAYMDTVSGVFFPRGGIRALPDAMAAAAADAGVTFRYDATVTELVRRGDRIGAVRTADGEQYEADAVVLTTELPTTYELLGRAPRRVSRLRPAPSAVVAHVGCASPDPATLGADATLRHHHSILFGQAWRSTFDDIIGSGSVMSDPSLLVTRPTVTDPDLAPPGRDLLYVLAPTPNLQVGRVDWARRRDDYVAHMLDTANERMPGLDLSDAEVLHVVDPVDWARQGMLAGTPFALAHTFGQTGPFRPANTVRGTVNVVLAGGSTVPGVGVPTAVVSGRLAADRVTGSVRAVAGVH